MYDIPSIARCQGFYERTNFAILKAITSFPAKSLARACPEAEPKELNLRKANIRVFL
jgi:hypothetical protein